MDIEPLLAPVDLDDSAGPDLAYSDARGEIERAFERASAGDEPDEGAWKATIDAIVSQAQETRDLWLGVYLARAGAKAGVLELVDDGCALLAGLVERQWEEVHPKLDEYGIAGRKAPCESLVRIAEFIGPLRRLPLVEHPRLGSFSGEDFDRFAREGEAAPGYGQFRAAIADTPTEQLDAAAQQLRDISTSIERVDAVLSKHAADANQTGTNFEPAYDAINTIIDALTPFVTQAAGGSEAAADSLIAADEGGVAAGGSAGKALVIDSREQVARALDSVIDYYARREPSSPIPEALRRIKGWIAMDFMAILRDISPTGVQDAERVLRVRVEEGERSDTM